MNINISELSSETLTHERENALQSGQFELLLGYFGFIYSAKQPFKMLDIVKNLNHRGVKTKLIICGDFPDGHSEEKRKFIEYIELFNLNNFVDLRGYIDNEAALQLILSACDLNIQLYDDGVSTRRSSFWYAIEAGLNVITTKPHLQQEFVDIENFDVFNDSKLTLVDIDIPVSNMVEEICKLKAKWTPPLRRHVAVSWKDIGLSHVKIYREAEAAL
ncbi:MAG: hypothetical protein CFE44_02115 [Burkholderiales bacterium PBB4]|nr:MAG: hypothetical protein CFE44_02115 [Burkholderiales bacterium PBB4]